MVTVITARYLSDLSVASESKPQIFDDPTDPPFADSNEVAAAFSRWQANEPRDASLKFAEAGHYLATNMLHSADAFRRTGDRASAISTLLLTEIALRLTARHEGDLGLLDEEHETRSALVDVLRDTESLSGSDTSEKIEVQEERMAEIQTLEGYSGSPP